MRFDKFTTKLQEAFGEAQSLALGHDHQQIEPQHLLLALLNQEDGGIAPLVAQAGGNPNALKQALNQAIAGLPKVEGTPGEVHVSRDLGNLLNVADKDAQKRGDQYIASELFLRACAADKGEVGRLLKASGISKSSLEKAVEQVGSLDRKAIRDAIASGTFQTIIGPVSFKGQFNTQHTGYVGQWQDGAFKAISRADEMIVRKSA